MKLPLAPAARWLLAGSFGALAVGAACGRTARPAVSPHAAPGAAAAAPSPAAQATAPRSALPANGAASLLALERDLLPAEISTIGWDSLTDSPVVLLRERGAGKVVPIWVGVAEARAIALALHGVEPPRPQTHDLMRSLVESLGAKLVEVWVHELRGDVYYGLLRLQVDGAAEPIFVDTRPSDALALAARTGAAIKLGKAIVEQTPAMDFTAPSPGDQVVQIAGITVVAVDDELRRQRNLPARPGVLVVAVRPEAAAVGLRQGDLVVAVNGRPTATPMELLEAVRRAPPQLPLRISFWRDGEERTVELFLGEAPEPSGTRA